MESPQRATVRSEQGRKETGLDLVADLSPLHDLHDVVSLPFDRGYELWQTPNRLPVPRAQPLV